MPTQIGSRQLRSSSAHCHRSWRSDWRKVGKVEVDIEVDAEVVEDEEEKEKKEEEEKEEEEEEEENNCDKI